MSTPIQTWEKLTREDKKDWIDRLDKFNTKLKEQGICNICREKKITRLYRPCNHACCCDNCDAKIKDRCPICRASINDVVIINLSEITRRKRHINYDIDMFRRIYDKILQGTINNE